MCLTQDFANPNSPIRTILRNETGGLNDPIFGRLYRQIRGLNEIPAIPFFGRLDTAKVLTIGANPSSRELANGRDLRENAPANGHGHENYLESCREYFQRTPYPWFDGWTSKLGMLKTAYRDDTRDYPNRAAHVDLFMRPTKGISGLLGGMHHDLAERAISEGIEDLKEMLKTYRGKSPPRLILIGGSCGQTGIVNRLADASNGQLVNPDPGVIPPLGGRMRCRWSHWTWTWWDKIEVPVLNCSTGPSAQFQVERDLFQRTFETEALPYLRQSHVWPFEN